MFNIDYKNMEKRDEGNYHNNIPSKTEAEIFTVPVLEDKIKDTNEAIKRMEENFLEKDTEISEDTKELITSLKNKVRDYTAKLEELKNKEEKIPELV